MQKNIIFFILMITITFIPNETHGQDFKIIGSNIGQAGEITDTVNVGGFTVGINKYGGGFITQIGFPNLSNIMGVNSQRYGRGGQSSIRDMGRRGQYNPTQAGFNDITGTQCKITKMPGRMIINPRGCALYNGDGGYDYVRWENIGIDHPNYQDGNNSDIDGIEEENLSVTIDGLTYTKQEAEVYSDFDYYGEYENYTEIAGLTAPAIRHYLEYRFIRSTSLLNAAMKQFSKQALSAAGKWDNNKILSDISTIYPEGIYKGGEEHLNSIILSWSIRNDLDIWDPMYRYVQLNNGSWKVQNRSTGQFQGKNDTYKLRFIIAESNDENSGNALGFYRPETDINKFNIVGINEFDGSEAYKDSRTTSNFYLDVPHRTPAMSWIGFRSEIKGLIERGALEQNYPGVYEKLRQEVILIYGTPAEIKTAFSQLDNYFQNITSVKSNSKIEKQSFKIYPNPASGNVNILLNEQNSKIDIYNVLGQKVYSTNVNSPQARINVRQFGRTGIYFIKINNKIKKLIVHK